MHGTNVIRKLDRNTDGKLLQIHEMFYTLQGEGPFAGRPSVFIRLSGCHLACTFCDTVWDDERDPMLSVPEIAGRVIKLWNTNEKNKARRLAVITGGEPTRQNIDVLVQWLLDEKFAVQIETAGSFYRKCMLEDEVFTVVSPKTGFVHPSVEGLAIAYKYVIRATDQFDTDGLPICSTQAARVKPTRLARPPEELGVDHIYLSPCDEGEGQEIESKKNLRKAAELSLVYGYTLGIQLHKLIGLP